MSSLLMKKKAAGKNSKTKSGLINCDGISAHKGTTGKYYCGRRVLSCPCCDGHCGPTNGCNCSACHKLDLEEQDAGQKKKTIVKPPRDAAGALVRSSKGRQINCDGVEAKKGTTAKYYCGRRVLSCPCCDGRCGPTNGCNCSACHKMDLEEQDADQKKKKTIVKPSKDGDQVRSSKGRQINCDGVEAKKGKNGKYYCGRGVLSCPCCNGRCGPAKGCNCSACGKLDDPLTKQVHGINDGQSSPKLLPAEKRGKLPVERPVFKSTDNTSRFHENPTPSRPTWDPHRTPQIGYQLSEVTKGSDEYGHVESAFSKTMAAYNIQRVQRVQNLELWDRYQRQNMWMEKKLPGSKKVDERTLFHGTKDEHIDAICVQGFDPRVSGTSSGTRYGQGSYFARDASYSRNYSKGNKMFLAKVLIGQYTTGEPSFKRPPLKSSSSTDLYDSCVDNVTNPSIFVTFKQEQAYPEWLVEYVPRN